MYNDGNRQSLVKTTVQSNYNLLVPLKNEKNLHRFCNLTKSECIIIIKSKREVDEEEEPVCLYDEDVDDVFGVWTLPGGKKRSSYSIAALLIDSTKGINTSFSSLAKRWAYCLAVFKTKQSKK